MTNQIVVFDLAESPSDYFPIDTVYKASFARLAQFAAKRGIDLRFVLGAAQYHQGTFNSFWKYQNDEFIQFFEPFKSSMVFLRDRTQLLNAEKRVNNDFLEKICRDKYLTYQTFPEFVKKTILIEPSNLSNLDEIFGESVVLKPRFGAEGEKVQLVCKADITKYLVSEDEFIAQELIDSSKGIPGIINQRHEMRMYILNGVLQSAYLRLPAKNSFLSNISQGATVKLMDLEEIPDSAVKIKDLIDEKFSDIKPRLYTIDLMFENGQPWVVELNDQPGLPDIAVQPLTDNYLEALLDLLTSG